MTTEYAVAHRLYPAELHRGPYKTLEAAQDWINAAVADGLPEGTFLPVAREVSDWVPAPLQLHSSDCEVSAWVVHEGYSDYDPVPRCTCS